MWDPELKTELDPGTGKKDSGTVDKI